MTRAPFHALVAPRRDELVQALCKRLKSSESPNYRKVKQELLRSRCEKLVDAFLRSSKGDPAPFAAYIEQLTEERISEGYFLPEIQLLLSMLEEHAWSIAVEGSSIASLVPNLTLVTSTIGQAKDRLAQIFLAHKQRAETAAASLERRLEVCMQGTDAVLVDEG